MNIHKLTEILKCINCQQNSLQLQKEKNTLICSNCRREYIISEKVPILLPESEQQELTKPEIHKKLGTSFNYIDHYQKDALASNYFAERGSGTEHGDQRLREYITSYIKGNNGCILDVGCGSAWVARQLCPVGYEVISMDIALRNTSEALNRYPFENHSSVVADVFSLPFKECVFDYIVASEIIEHVSKPDVFIQKLFSALKPGGKLIVTTPYKEKLQYSLCIHCNKPTPLYAHIHSFDEKKLLSLYDSPEIKSILYKTFGNKIPIHLRFHKIFKYLNFSIWKLVDLLFNRIYYVPSRILVIWGKNISK